MQIFKKRLAPSWTFRSDEKVWRLLPRSGVLAVELRDPDKRNAEFAGIDLSTGSLLWKNDQLEEKWWIFLNKIHKDVLLLHQFVRPDMPTPGNIFALDLFTGKLLWQNQELSYLNAAGDMVYGLRKTLQSEDIVGLNYRTGHAHETLTSDDPRAHDVSLPEQEEDFVLPTLLEELDESPDSTAVGTTTKAYPPDADTPTLLTTASGKLVIGYHVNSGTDEKGVPVYDSHIKILDEVGRVLFEDTADRRVYTTLQDFYFMVNDYLLYVKNSNEIVAVRLS